MKIQTQKMTALLLAVMVTVLSCPPVRTEAKEVEPPVVIMIDPTDMAVPIWEVSLTHWMRKI